jgi:anti-sigma factor RsiW
MMTCRDFADFLDRFITGELPAPLATQFEAHLGECQACRNYLDGYRKTMQASRAALGAQGDPVPPQVPESLVKAILAARRGK